ncbi:13537_t:CDS:2 [Acaulospora morrowiae]|uniref:13537_t:CDS:1 n=1 Tax=Acaulospora morrowiae TaxID=94023 RepID=A0A9N9EWL1_9GLOM|nr:13537_t:CDS:2 [Acaulospora morrowiae]
MATTPPFPFLASHPVSVHTTPAAVVPPLLSRRSVYSSDPRAHLISANNAQSYVQVYSSSFPTEHQFSANNNILPPINSTQLTNNSFNAPVNGMHFTSGALASSPQHVGCHSSSPAIRPRLELRRCSEPNYHIAYRSPTTMSGFSFESGQQQQQQSTSPQKKQAIRISTLSKILQSNDDEELAKNRQVMQQINVKRQRFGNMREDEDRDSEDCDSSSSNGYLDGCISECLSPQRMVITNKSSSVTTNDSSDTGSILGEPVPQQQQILRQNKGLRHFSKQVCDKVELKGVTTYNEVADELAGDFAAQMKEHGGQKVDQKNIRRRVYDALNVLMAMDIIAKDKKEIRWLGLPGRQIDTNLASSSETTEVEIDRQNSEIRELERLNRRLSKQVDEAKIAFQEKIARHLHIRNLVKRNKQRHDPYRISNKAKSEKEVYLPFKLVHYPRGTTVNNQTAQDGVTRTLSFQPHRPTIIEDTQVLRCLGMDKISLEDIHQWVKPEHLKWIITKQGDDGDYRISCKQ